MSDQGDDKGGLFRSLLGHPEDAGPRLDPPTPPPPPASEATIDLTRTEGDDDLVAAIEGSDPGTRRAALGILAQRELTSRLAKAAAAALKDPEPDVRLAALRAIERAPRLAPVDSLESATLDWDPAVRARALAALGRTQRASVLATIHQRLASETEELVIDAGLVALGQLLQTALRPFPPSTLQGVTRAIAQLASPIRQRHRDELGLIARVIREDDLIELLGRSDDDVRLGAAALVVERGSIRASQALSTCTEDENPHIRDLAIEAASALQRGQVKDPGGSAGFDIERFGRRSDDVSRRSSAPARAEEGIGAPDEATGGKTGRFTHLLQLLATDAGEERAQARQVAAEFDREEMVELVESYLEDAPPRRALEVARLLSHLNRTEVIPFLARGLLEMDDVPERAELAKALAPHPDMWGLIAMLQNDPSADRRSKALLLSTLTDPSRTGPLVAGLRDPHATVRIAAISAIPVPLSDEVDDHLLEIVASDASPKARVAAIGRFKASSSDRRVRAAEVALRSHVTEARVAAIDLLDGTSDEELGLLARALHDHEIRVAEKAITYLGSMRAPEALAVLWSSLRLVEQPVQELILTAMEEFDREAVVFLGRQALDSADPGDRVLGLSVLSRLETDPSDRLLMALEDPAPAVRVEALRNALSRPEPAVVNAVGGRLRDPEPAIRALALRVLEAIEDDRTLPFFVDGAKDPAPEVRRAAKDALLKHSSDAVIELLLKALGFPTHRRAAADLLMELGRPAVERLTAALPGAAPEVRRMLGEILRESDAQGLLIEELTHRDPDRRMRAVSGLGAIGSQQAVPGLIDRIRDPDASVRAEVARVLGQIGDVRAIEPLKQAFISDPDMEVVRAIEPALRKLTGGSDR